MYKANINGRSLLVTGNENEMQIDGTPFNADIFEYKEGKYHILIDNKSYSAELISVDRESKICQLKIDSSIVTVQLEDDYDNLLHVMGMDQAAGKKVNDIKAPMPGLVLQVMVEMGQQIRKGDNIVVLEAMKMENILKSPADGIIRKIHVNSGDKVEKNQVMVNLE